MKRKRESKLSKLANAADDVQTKEQGKQKPKKEDKKQDYKLDQPIKCSQLPSSHAKMNVVMNYLRRERKHVGKELSNFFPLVLTQLIREYERKEIFPLSQKISLITTVWSGENQVKGTPRATRSFLYRNQK